MIRSADIHAMRYFVLLKQTMFKPVMQYTACLRLQCSTLAMCVAYVSQMAFNTIQLHAYVCVFAKIVDDIEDLISYTNKSHMNL
jgi:hypothetical protein